MDIFFHHSYNLDLLNLLNIVNGDSHYQNLYPQFYAEFGQPFSIENKNVLNQITNALGSTMVSAPIAFGISIVPQFDKAPLIELLLDRDRFLTAVEHNEPRLDAQKEQLLILFEVLAPVIQELETLGFREYWLSERLPIIEDRIDKVETFYLQSRFSSVFNELIGSEDLPDELNIYFCSLNGGNGVRLSSYTAVVDISFSTEKIFDFALHEFFQHALTKPGTQNLLESLMSDAFLKLAWEKSSELTGINSMSGYVQENVATAYISYLFYKSGLLAEPIEFLRSHQHGAFVLSVILMDHLIWQGMQGESMISDLENWLTTRQDQPFMELYQQALDRSGKKLGD